MDFTGRGISLLALGSSLVAGAVSVGVATQPPRWGAWYVVLLFVLAAGFLVAGAAFVLLGLFSGPRLSIENPRVLERRVGPSGRWAEFAYVDVVNRARYPRSPAEDVFGQITFRTPQRDEPVEVIERARWSHFSQDPSPESMTVPPEVTIPANRGARMLDVALKYTPDNDCYAFNDENYLAKEFRHRPLGGRRFIVEVEVFGSNAHAKATFELGHEGPDTHLTFRELNELRLPSG